MACGPSAVGAEPLQSNRQAKDRWNGRLKDPSTRPRGPALGRSNARPVPATPHACLGCDPTPPGQACSRPYEGHPWGKPSDNSRRALEGHRSQHACRYSPFPWSPQAVPSLPRRELALKKQRARPATAVLRAITKRRPPQNRPRKPATRWNTLGIADRRLKMRSPCGQRPRQLTRVQNRLGAPAGQAATSARLPLRWILVW